MWILGFYNWDELRGYFFKSVYSCFSKVLVLKLIHVLLAPIAFWAKWKKGRKQWKLRVHFIPQTIHSLKQNLLLPAWYYGCKMLIRWLLNPRSRVHSERERERQRNISSKWSIWWHEQSGWHSWPVGEPGHSLLSPIPGLFLYHLEILKGLSFVRSRTSLH